VIYDMVLDRCAVSVRSDLKIQSPYLFYSRTLRTGDSLLYPGLDYA